MSDVLNALLASLAEDFDIEVVERTDHGTWERVRIDLKVSQEQLQAARSKVIDARAGLSIADWKVAGTLEDASSDR